MIILLALIPATGLTMVGYIVLYVSGRNEGSLRTFGRWLAFWAFTLAALVVLGGVFAAGHMHREGHPGMWGMHHRFEHSPPPEALPPPPGPEAATPAPTPPAAH